MAALVAVNDGRATVAVGVTDDLVATYNAVDLVKRASPEIPTFGVCLGLQAIGQAFGGKVVRAPQPVHGKTDTIHHQGRSLFAGLPSPLTATRYHSLAIEPATLPDSLEVSARTESGVIMAVRHRELAVECVQFHPESVLTEGGYQMLANWLAVCGDDGAVRRSTGLAPLVSHQDR